MNILKQLSLFLQETAERKARLAAYKEKKSKSEALKLSLQYYYNERP